MYDTAKRVALVKQRVRENTRRRQRRGIYGLSAACMLLFAVMMQAADVFAVQEQTAAWGVFGAMLLREDVAAMCWWPSSPLQRRWSLPCFAHD